MSRRTQILNREPSADQTGYAIFRNKLARVVRPPVMKVTLESLKAKF
jgi:hypothetical protein